MTDPKVFKPHIHLGATGKRESYTSPIQGGTRKEMDALPVGRAESVVGWWLGTYSAVQGAVR